MCNYATSPPPFVLCRRHGSPVPDELRHAIVCFFRKLPCHGASPARSVGRAREGFALQAKHLRHGRRSLSHGRGDDRRDSGEANAEGNFTIYSKQEHKRSGSYGFRVQGDRIIPAEAGANIAGNYVGYPMGYWCEFAPAYGFHQGFVHLHPRSHGCVRLKGEAAPKFYALVKIGTPVNIAETQPEDATLGLTQRFPSSTVPKHRIRRIEFQFRSRVQNPSGPLF